MRLTNRCPVITFIQVAQNEILPSGENLGTSMEKVELEMEEAQQIELSR